MFATSLIKFVRSFTRRILSLPGLSLNLGSEYVCITVTWNAEYPHRTPHAHVSHSGRNGDSISTEDDANFAPNLSLDFE